MHHQCVMPVHQHKTYRNVWQVLIVHSCALRRMPLRKNSVSLDKRTFQSCSTPAKYASVEALLLLMINQKSAFQAG